MRAFASTKIEKSAIERARVLAAYYKVSLGDYLSGLLEPGLLRDFARMVAELEEMRKKNGETSGDEPPDGAPGGTGPSERPPPDGSSNGGTSNGGTSGGHRPSGPKSRGVSAYFAEHVPPPTERPGRKKSRREGDGMSHGA